MRLVLTSGAAFVGGEMCYISSHTLCRDQRATWMHLMITYEHVHARSVQVHASINISTQMSRVNTLQG